MTIKELILDLKKFDEKLTILVDGCEGGVTKEFEGLSIETNLDFYEVLN